ncbi:hypothetical protein T484DRAFT_1784235 [Baffinella frigidus]|nr:hypothetical protein T484DRAFT_1784235 [Cryptophyta sp. CCMP2293]
MVPCPQALATLAVGLSSLEIGPQLAMLAQLALWFPDSYRFSDAAYGGASPLRWAISSIIKAELRGTTWEGATLLLDTDGPDLQILDTLKAGLFETAGSEDTFRSDVLNIAAIGLAFKIATVLLVLGMTLSERFRSRTV